MTGQSRRRFLRGVAAVSAAAALAHCAPRLAPSSKQPTGEAEPTLSGETASAAADVIPEGRDAAAPKPGVGLEPSEVPSTHAYLAVARGEDPAAITERVVAALGGMERFVSRGDDVIVKPNICNANRTYEYASTTNPGVVAALVRLCLGAGARRVRVMDFPFSGSPQAAYARSGIEEVVRIAGGQMEVMAAMAYADVDIPDGKDLRRWRFYQPILDADVVINVPIAKHHSLARLTLGGKNLMGCIDSRSQMHRNLGQRIADLTSLVRPELTLVDAVRILVANGPTGGSLNDVRLTNTVIASHDVVAADAYACSLFGVRPDQIGYIAASAAMGLGTLDLASVRVEELVV
jgi:uncharacterized protein (DUF362 family)